MAFNLSNSFFCLESISAAASSYKAMIKMIKTSYELMKSYQSRQTSGVDPGFSFCGGRKRLCVHTYITSTKPEVPHDRGPGPASVRALEALRVFDALLYYLSLIFNPN